MLLRAIYPLYDVAADAPGVSTALARIGMPDHDAPYGELPAPIIARMWPPPAMTASGH
jgi:hypothetical protein